MSASGVTLLDGPTGTELSRRGHDTRLPLWSARPLAEHPEAVEEIHADFVKAGADLLTTCTFRTHARNLAHAGWQDRVDELNRLAVDVARRAAARVATHPTRVAGSISPLEDCYRPDLVPPDDDLRAEHACQARSLAAAGADLLLVETMNCRREADAAVRAAVATGLPTWCSWVADGRGHLLSGEPIADAAHSAEDLGAVALLVNCVPVAEMLRDVEDLLAATDLPVGCSGNIGHARDVDGWRVDLMLTPEEFAAEAMRCREAGARILGGCCGSQPEHLAALAEALRRADGRD